MTEPRASPLAGATSPLAAAASPLAAAASSGSPLLAATDSPSTIIHFPRPNSGLVPRVASDSQTRRSWKNTPLMRTNHPDSMISSTATTATPGSSSLLSSGDFSELLAPPLLQGYVDKQAIMGLKLYQKRYFRQTDNLLQYFASSRSKGSPRGNIDLCKVTEIWEVLSPLGVPTGEIDIILSNRTYRIRPLSPAELQYWKDGLKAAHTYWVSVKGYQHPSLPQYEGRVEALTKNLQNMVKLLSGEIMLCKDPVRGAASNEVAASLKHLDFGELEWSLTDIPAEELLNVHYLRFVFLVPEADVKSVIARLDAKGCSIFSVIWKNHSNIVMNPFYSREDAKKNNNLHATLVLSIPVSVRLSLDRLYTRLDLSSSFPTGLACTACGSTTAEFQCSHDECGSVLCKACYEAFRFGYCKNCTENWESKVHTDDQLQHSKSAPISAEDIAPPSLEPSSDAPVSQ